MQTVSCDYLVMGSGIAGMSVALKAARTGSVILITKKGLIEGSTPLAQGGIAAALGQEDSPREHMRDTLEAGAGLCNPHAVEVLVSEGPDRVRELELMGTRFDRTPDGSLALGREAAHGRNRIVHAGGDRTGAEVARVLACATAANPNIEVMENTFAAELMVQDGRCTGAWAVANGNKVYALLARGVVLATGGCGQLYRYTTNPKVATGDGIALAYRAGATIDGMEFIQFHPTAMASEDNPLFLISEAVRGDGAVLVTESGQRFMPRYHPLAELAPRDEVARAIYSEMRAGHRVYLDATRLGQSFPERFPAIHRHCLEKGIDPMVDPIPVAPAAHFLMGGVAVDLWGRTSVDGLFACGEVACTWVHGANRLAGNSLLEGLVFAHRVAEALARLPRAFPSPPELDVPPRLSGLAPTTGKPGDDPLRRELQTTMWEGAGIVRSASGLAHAVRTLCDIENNAPEGDLELGNMLTVAMLVTTVALRRAGSRGAHYRID